MSEGQGGGSGSGGSSSSGDKRKKRRRRRPKGGGMRSSHRGPGARSSEGGESDNQAAGAGPRSGKRRARGRRRRGDEPRRTGDGARRSGEERQRGGEPRRRNSDPRHSDSARPAATSTAVDDSWDPNDSAAGAEAAPPARQRPAREERIPWGDDSDAPEPDAQVIPLHPREPSDDPDPTTAPLDALEHDPPEPSTEPAVQNVVGVKYQRDGKIKLFDAGDDSYRAGEWVMVEADRGNRLAQVAVGSDRRPHSGSLRRVVRSASKRESGGRERSRDREVEILSAARAAARDQKLPIKVFRAELNPSGSRCVIYFSADERTDGRGLIKALKDSFPGRLELRQTGVRDEAKMTGGIGSCGMELCCSTWLPSFVPVSIKNAKDQGLVLNPAKISGQCGRLKCCLVYEQETYASLRKGLPKLGKRVITEQGEGRVVEVDVLRRRVRVNHGHGDVKVYEAGEVKPMFPSQKPASQKTKPEEAPGEES